MLYTIGLVSKFRYLRVDFILTFWPSNVWVSLSLCLSCSPFAGCGNLLHVFCVSTELDKWLLHHEYSFVSTCPWTQPLKRDTALKAGRKQAEAGGTKKKRRTGKTDIKFWSTDFCELRNVIKKFRTVDISRIPKARNLSLSKKWLVIPRVWP